MNALSGFLNDESAATALEYAWLASLISIASVGALRIIGTKLSSNFSTISASL
ncbi:MAG TPA: Flp family type IVb pilin [Candidatus Binatia bacterium]|jgi:pilus assembly protein Flp/PilA